MDRRLDAGGLLVAASAVLLVVSEFLDWFGGPGGGHITAWQAFEVLDLVLLAAAVAAIAAAFGRLPSQVLLGAAGLVAVVVVSQLLQRPPAAQGVGATYETGIWLALAAAAGMLAGATLAAAQIAVTVDVRGRERRPRVPAVDSRTAAEPPRADPEAQTRVAPEGDPFARSSGDPLVDPDATQAFTLPTESDEPKP
jgi:hypothetical protein